MDKKEFISRFTGHPALEPLLSDLEQSMPCTYRLKGLVGSSLSLIVAAAYLRSASDHWIVMPDQEAAAYFLNDLESLFDEVRKDLNKKRVLFYPASYRRTYAPGQRENDHILQRTEVLNRIGSEKGRTIVVTYPEALTEKVVERGRIKERMMTLSLGEAVDLDFVCDVLSTFSFERVDFVVEPGQYAMRGGIIDVFSFANEFPFRIEFAGSRIESLRSFDPESQLSRDQLAKINLLPDVEKDDDQQHKVPIAQSVDAKSVWWMYGNKYVAERMTAVFENICAQQLEAGKTFEDSCHSYVTGQSFLSALNSSSIIEFGEYSTAGPEIILRQQPQPSFNKNFEILLENLRKNREIGLDNIILTDNPRQAERIYAIMDDIQSGDVTMDGYGFSVINITVHEGFTDEDVQLACYTDHQIFDRYHRFRLRDSYRSKEALTIRELNNLQPGDFVSHIDHGVGRFGGLEKIENNGKWQEAIRIVYQNNDLLYVSIHSLHRITKYVGKEGTEPSLDRLGSGVWKKLKNKTKSKVKDIAKDLIRLYAERKATEGFAFSPDSYLQHELEASFIYEDTPDQLKATQDVKKDLEASYPMDRLICGDVGFGKTEVALRAAFKVVADSKQVALLVPTTILALQHYKTFKERLGEFPATVDYINRFKSAAEQKETLKRLKEGKVDILIGTHRLLSKDIGFKDLGLLIIDEEQKFGVAAKEKLKQFRVNVDTLILTATPIPRTLQFSMMGARDLSVINTPPPNRQPVHTELRAFGEDVIRDAINYEISRGGQTFFVHNRVQNIGDVATMIRKFLPGISVAVAHGQMDGKLLEQIMLEFIEGQYDVLVSTTIIESGLDIPNVNTIIINDAQNYGLSDLHQLRGRVGRSNRKAFCYLLTPPLSILPTEARKRLRAIEEFSGLGSGFSIAMRDLDIRGAGNILGAEQSGFISEIGYEMYQKILDEALQELRQGEFKEYFKDDQPETFVQDCVIETDLELLIPDNYVTNITERLSLYKELDSIENDENLKAYRQRIVDRFGELPQATAELIQSIRMRWEARDAGMEKLILRGGRMTGYFIRDEDSTFFQSENFTKILRFVQANAGSCTMKESKGRLSLTFHKVASIADALAVLKSMNQRIT